MLLLLLTCILLSDITCISMYKLYTVHWLIVVVPVGMWMTVEGMKSTIILRHTITHVRPLCTTIFVHIAAHTSCMYVHWYIVSYKHALLLWGMYGISVLGEY